MFIFADPRTWVGVAFIVFFLIFGRKLWSALKEQLDAKTNAIRSDFEEAASLRAEAERLMLQAKEERKKAQDEASAMIERSKAEADFLEQETQKRLKEDADNYLKRTEIQIEAMKQAAKDSLQQEVLETAIKIASEVLEKDLEGNKDLREVMTENSLSRLSEMSNVS